MPDWTSSTFFGPCYQDFDGLYAGMVGGLLLWSMLANHWAYTVSPFTYTATT